MTARATGPLVPGDTRPITVYLRSDVTADLTTMSGASLFVHRAYGTAGETTETWPCAITAQTTSTATIVATPANPITTAGEEIKARPYVVLTSATVPFEAFLMTVEEK